ncbi:hypothetical protein E2R68_10470 [Psychromonas sp. RZ22]|uniref:general secretion pathway protein GspB n=1 Tax=Psychromonas algarum TaxID=2555643 RepID=UPI001068402B|nr:general secretion pathway protein GspB [Psychromonas sp. RZ22]TEW53904.1 hypothetical protein E2R68_10470 [Psychromonas sp. RZ22]
MSTILKALDKNKHNLAVGGTEQSLSPYWKGLMVTAGLVIVILSSVVVFLIFKPSVPTQVINTELSQEKAIQIQQQSVQQTPVSHEIQMSKVNQYAVSDMNFKTQPLPIIPKVDEMDVKWVSAEKLSVKQPIKKTKEIQVEKSPVNEAVTEQVASNDHTLADVPSELQERFARAVELEQQSNVSDIKRNRKANLPETDISLMPVQFQFQVPVMRYDSHMYSTNKDDRWIRINGIDLHVGDHIGDVELIDILPKKSVFRLGEQSFTLDSLEDWTG